MRTRLVAFDMDGTLVDTVSSWAFVHHHFGEDNSEALRLFLTDRIDDSEFIRRDLALWSKHDPQLTSARLKAILDRVPLVTGAPELFDGLRRAGVTTAIVSGGIDLLADRIGRELRIDHVLANGFEVDASGRLTGEPIVRVPIRGKGGVLRALQERLRIPPESTAAVGNSEIDVAMFERAARSVAFRPEDDLVRGRAGLLLAGTDLAECLSYLIGA
ncbi:MAG: HAD-IB family phosphatase [Thermoplasmata archaeon]